jgi:hypothetical protein
MTHNQYTAATFVDVSATVDNMQYDILVHKLAKLDVPQHILSVMIRRRYNKHVTFTHDNSVRVIYEGPPQREVLNPFLYNIYVSDDFEGIRNIQ